MMVGCMNTFESNERKDNWTGAPERLILHALVMYSDESL